MVARLSSKNFKKLIFLAHFVSKHASTCPSGMTRQMMKIAISEAKKHSPPCNPPHSTPSMTGMLQFQDQMPAARSLPDANSQKNGLARNCPGQRRSPTTAQKPRLQTIWLANLFASLPQYPQLIHNFTTNCAGSQASTIAFLQSRISL